ncbi:hypothetical protein IAU60_006746 [Kwoniella sp. DSM 27419]
MLTSIKSVLVLILLSSAVAWQFNTMSTKNVIVQFKKTSSSEDRQKTISDIKAKGASIVNDDNVDSKLMPFITVSVPENDYSALEADFADHGVVDNIELDQVVTTQ